MEIQLKNSMENVVISYIENEYINIDKTTGVYYFSIILKEIKFKEVYNINKIEKNTVLVSAIQKAVFTDNKTNSKQMIYTPIYAFVKKEQITKALETNYGLILSLDDLGLNEESFFEFFINSKFNKETNEMEETISEIKSDVKYRISKGKDYDFELIGIKENSITLLASNF